MAQQPQSSRWTLRTEIQACLGISQELWGNLAKIHDHNSAVAAWQLILDGEGVGEGELIEALKIWAKGSDGTYPPRPSNLLEILKRERVARVHREELNAWRAALSPTLDADGNIHFLEFLEHAELGEGTEVTVISLAGVLKRLPI